MEVRLLIGRSGPAGSFKSGDVIEVSDEEGKRLVEAGKASLVASAAPQKKREKAKLEPRKETRGH